VKTEKRRMPNDDASYNVVRCHPTSSLEQQHSGRSYGGKCSFISGRKEREREIIRDINILNFENNDYEKISKV
jgi:hypothetical protein